jgi:hypothetical protein
MVVVDGRDLVKLVAAFLVGPAFKGYKVTLWQVGGKPSAHQLVCEAMIKDPEVQEFEH